MNECCFCQEYVDSYNNPYYNQLGKDIHQPSRIILESPNWYVIPTIGCLTVGYMLLVCKKHYLSLANLDFELYQEMLALKEKTENIIFDKLGHKCISFEHGTTNGYSGANSVEHVHLHIVPFVSDVWDDIANKNQIENYIRIDKFTDLLNLWKITNPKSYLLFQDLDKKIYYIPDAYKYPSQFFRKCISPYYGTNNWDWKQDIHIENFIKTLEIFKNN